MKSIATIALLLASQFLASLQAQTSKHFAAVKEHLELGGEALTYVDLDGDAAKVAAFLDELIGFVAEAAGQENLPLKGSVKDLVATLGLGNISAVGSSSKTEEGRTATRAYLHLDGARQGLLKTLGGPAAPFAAARLAPAGTDLVFERDLDFSEFPKMIDSLVAQIGEREVRDGWRQAGAQKVGPLDLTLREVLGKLNTRVLLVGRLHDTERFQPAGAPVDLPKFEALLRFDNMAWLVEKLRAELPADALQEGDGFLRLPFGPVPPEEPIIEPLAHYDTATGQLYFATGEAFLKECLAGSGGLFAEPAFAKFAAGLPEKGNGFNYASKRFGKEMSKVYRAAIAADGQLPEGAVDAITKMVETSMPGMTGGVVSASANLPDGVLSVSFSEGSKSSGIGAAATVAAAIAASVSFPVFAAVQNRAGQNKELTTLKQCALAGLAYASDHDGQYPDNIDSQEMIDLVGTDRIFKFPNRQTGEVRRPLYVSGLTDSASARFVLLASPWIYRGQRAVIYADGSGELVEERTFEKLLFETLEKSGGKLVE